MPISEGQITNKVEIIFAGETCRLLGKHEEKSKESQEHCPTALFCTGVSTESSQTSCLHVVHWCLRVRNNTLKEE